MKVYYNQDKIASNFRKFFANIFSLSKPILKNLSFIILGMINAESVITADISRKLTDEFSFINLESIERRFRRFFSSFSSIAYSFYEAFIKFIISKYTVKHADNNVFISFDHMYCKHKYTILLFSLRIGKQGIPIWFRCFKEEDKAEAFKISLINQGISFCSSLFSNHNYNIIFLADRWFSFREIMQHIQDIGSFYCIRTKSNISIDIGNYDLPYMVTKIEDIEPRPWHARYFENVKITSFNFTTNLVVAPLSNEDPLYVITNVSSQKALKYYGYRFGSIECIFKSQKSNGFRLESTNTKKIEHFISLFTVMCVALCWLTILGADYVKNKHHYHLEIRDVRRHKNSSISRAYSLFNLGLTIFNICFNSWIDFRLKFNFILYDI